VADEFAHYRLRVGGLVEAPREFSFAVATRFDKLAATYLAFIQLASIRLWLPRSYIHLNSPL
jgi:hypothetical protein